MKKKITLKINTLGGLHISNGKLKFPQDKKRSAQVELLILCLIMNRNLGISNSQLINVLWSDGNADKPEGALRNLVYRARKELKPFFEEKDCIISKGRSYNWNNEIECKFDYEELLKLCRKTEQEHDPKRKYARCIELINKYNNDFLPEYNYNKWVIGINNSLEITCLEVILATLDVLAKNNLFEEILVICNHQNIQRIMDTRLYEMKLFAYYQTGKIDMALSFYRQIVDYYYSKYGIEVSPRLKEIYELVLDKTPSAQIGVAELEKCLKTEDDNSTFYCDFDVFKNIYLINVRSAKRSMKARALILLSIVDESKELNEDELEQEANILKEVISCSLRKNDVFSKFNLTQYSLILDSPDLAGAQVAINRIMDRYNEKKKHEAVILTYDLKQIC